MDSFGKRLRKAREDNNLTQSELAKRLGYKQNSPLSAIESDKTSPSLETLQKIVGAINVDLHWLITGKPASIEAIIQRTRIDYMQLCKEYEDASQIEQELESKKAAGQKLTPDEETALLVNRGITRSRIKMMQNLLESNAMELKEKQGRL